MPGAVQRNQLVGQRGDVEHVLLGDGLDLPGEEVEVPLSPSVIGAPVERAMLWVDVELDTPAATWHGEIDASSAPTIGPDESGLVLDRYATCAQYLGQHDLRVRLVRCAGGEA